MEMLRRLSEELARRTSRRGLLGKGAGVATGALLGVAAGTLTRPDRAVAGIGTQCSFPGPGCPCGGCTEAATCGKPCVVNTTWYASGCWVAGGGSITCCDCDCRGMPNDIPPIPGVNHNVPLGTPIGVCGCGTDYHSNPQNCPP